MNKKHDHHPHVHGTDCGHPAIQHGDHVDYLHDGHLHHPTAAGAVEEHAIGVNASNPGHCTGGHACSGHTDDHVHGPGCGHPAIPHGDHVDYLVEGHLHHPHQGHCDHHGEIQVVSRGGKSPV